MISIRSTQSASLKWRQQRAEQFQQSDGGIKKKISLKRKCQPKANPPRGNPNFAPLNFENEKSPSSRTAANFKLKLKFHQWKAIIITESSSSSSPRSKAFKWPEAAGTSGFSDRRFSLQTVPRLLLLIWRRSKPWKFERGKEGEKSKWLTVEIAGVKRLDPNADDEELFSETIFFNETALTAERTYFTATCGRWPLSSKASIRSGTYWAVEKLANFLGISLWKPPNSGQVQD